MFGFWVPFAPVYEKGPVSIFFYIQNPGVCKANDFVLFQGAP